MRTARRKLTGDDAGALNREDWDFSAVPNEELVACCYWEYARESTFIRDVRRRCSDPRCRQMINSEQWQHFGHDIERIQSIGHPAEVFLAGLFFDEAEDRKPRHRDARAITGSFPAPWQTLSAAERKTRSRIRTDREAIPLIAFQRGYTFFAEDIARWCQNQKDEAQRSGKEIHPSLYLGGSEVGVFRIQWADFTNEELVDGFRQWVKVNRPERFPKPSGKGRKPGDQRAQLTRLAVMRLLAHFKPAAIFDAGNRETQAIWATRRFAGRKWLDAVKWHDARREAMRCFHQLFPFLPAADHPLSWARRTPGK